jgi:hypothetical protein
MEGKGGEREEKGRKDEEMKRWENCTSKKEKKREEKRDDGKNTQHTTRTQIKHSSTHTALLYIPIDIYKALLYTHRIAASFASLFMSLS